MESPTSSRISRPVPSAASASAALDRVQRIVDLVLSLLILASLLLFAAGFFRGSSIASLWPVVQLHRFGDPIVAAIAALLPAAARTYAALLLAAVIYVVMLIADRLFAAARRGAAKPRPAAVKNKTARETTSVESEKARAKLLAEYQQIEKTLMDAKRRRCTFLSVDVVGSTLMKLGETQVAASATFRAYEELLRKTFKATHAWKDSWTPDGVMVCFLNLSDAVKAAQTILQQLPTFNERENRLKTPFEVRCGVNEGEVVIFEDSSVEKLVEQTIDIAGHMQKYAKPGTLWLGKAVYDALDDRSGFLPTGEEVDGWATYEWSPKPIEERVAAK